MNNLIFQLTLLGAWDFSTILTHWHLLSDQEYIILLAIGILAKCHVIWQYIRLDLIRLLGWGTVILVFSRLFYSIHAYLNLIYMNLLPFYSYVDLPDFMWFFDVWHSYHMFGFLYVQWQLHFNLRLLLFFSWWCMKLVLVIFVVLLLWVETIAWLSIFICFIMVWLLE